MVSGGAVVRECSITPYNTYGTGTGTASDRRRQGTGKGLLGSSRLALLRLRLPSSQLPGKVNPWLFLAMLTRVGRCVVGGIVRKRRPLPVLGHEEVVRSSQSSQAPVGCPSLSRSLRSLQALSYPRQSWCLVLVVLS